MNVYILILRLIHILAGVFWAGGVLLMAAFVGPSIRDAGPAGGTVMQKLAGDRRVPDWLAGAAVVTVLAGLLLYWEASGGLSGGWISSPTGIAFSVGGLAGIAAAVIGTSVAAPAIRRIIALAREVQTGVGQPSTEQSDRLARLQRRSTLAIRWVAALAFVAVAGMAIAERL